MRTQLLIAAMIAGTAMAQTDPAGAGAAPPAEVVPAAGAPAPAPRGEVPDPEKIRESADALAKMRQQLKDVLAKLEEARATKDVVKLNCVNEKLTQIKGLLRISEQADVALQEAVAKREGSTAQHEYTKVTIARQKVDQLRAEAEECIGQLAFRTDENLQVVVEEPEDLPSGDPSRPPPVLEIVLRPPPASPM
ncbi:MAG: hypothetical protein HYZ28_10475 [Myxococcales bacterium]|nr:hypothetical protein [Myxococcales bacterium]